MKDDVVRPVVTVRGTMGGMGWAGGEEECPGPGGNDDPER